MPRPAQGYPVWTAPGLPLTERDRDGHAATSPEAQIMPMRHRHGKSQLISTDHGELVRKPGFCLI
jgi:hypothetical protein